MKPHLFQPGKSGNPGGRPKAVAELLGLARRHVPRAIRFAAKLLKDEAQDPRIRLEAAKFIAAYGLGKPPALEISAAADGDSSQPLTVLSHEQLLTLVREASGAKPNEH